MPNRYGAEEQKMKDLIEVINLMKRKLIKKYGVSIARLWQKEMN